MPRPERRLAAILFSDIVGYTALMARDEAAGLRARERHRRLLSDQARGYHGEVVDENGDELVLCFPSAVEAVNCALAVQAELVGDPEVRLRIGIHTGDVVFQEGRVYGDGVNVASRVRPHAEPGGVCVSAPVHDAVKNQLNVEGRSLGEPALKNVERPVEVFALQGIAAAPSTAAKSRQRGRGVLTTAATGVAIVSLGLWAAWPLPLGWLVTAMGVGAPPENPALPAKPSIVVLPFDDLSEDAEQGYFAAGITEELTTELSRNEALFVISRSSASTYEGRTVSVEDIGRELGVRYVLEGSIRRDGKRVRVAAQLTDAKTSFQRWGERYDRDLADIFSLQSELAVEIQKALQVEIRDAEMDRIRRAGTSDLRAHDAMMRGLVHFEYTRRDENLEARRWFARAFELDPDFAAAHAMYGNTYNLEYMMGWNRDPELVARAEASARRALALGDISADAHNVLGNIHMGRGELEEALAAYDRGISAEPSHDIPHLLRGVALSLQGRPFAAIRSIRQSLRLNPKGRPSQYMLIATVNYRAGRIAEAVRLAEDACAENPDMIIPRLLLAAHHAGEGSEEKARELVAEVRDVNPRFTAADATAFNLGFGKEDVFRRLGLP